MDPESLPTDTTLRRAIAEGLAAGQHWSVAQGRLPQRPRCELADVPVLTTLLPGFAGTSLPEWLNDRLRAGLGGVCLFGPNIDLARSAARLTDAIYAANPRALIAIDEEGGDVTRLFHESGRRPRATRSSAASMT